MLNPISEADLIEAAYEDQVRVLYRNLLTGLADGGSNPSSGVEQLCLQHFNLGLMTGQAGERTSALLANRVRGEVARSGCVCSNFACNGRAANGRAPAGLAAQREKNVTPDAFVERGVTMRLRDCCETAGFGPAPPSGFPPGDRTARKS